MEDLYLFGPPVMSKPLSVRPAALNSTSQQPQRVYALLADVRMPNRCLASSLTFDCLYRQLTGHAVVQPGVKMRVALTAYTDKSYTYVRPAAVYDGQVPILFLAPCWL